MTPRCRGERRRAGGGRIDSHKFHEMSQLVNGWSVSTNERRCGNPTREALWVCILGHAVRYLTDWTYLLLFIIIIIIRLLHIKAAQNSKYTHFKT